MTCALLFLFGIALGWFLSAVFCGMEMYELRQHCAQVINDMRDDYERQLAEMRARDVRI